MVQVASTLPPLSRTLPRPVLALENALADYLPSEQVNDVHRAYLVSEAAHAGQRRLSGEAYIFHPVAVAQILADMYMDAETIMAALLHDTVEDTPLSLEDLGSEFGPAIRDLVAGVTKLDKLDFASRRDAAAENLRRMMLAMSRDIRVILIKLADRLHNMRTLDAMPAEKVRRVARETLEIYAPIAQRLGMNRIKAELQDLGFRAMHPRRYQVISERLRKARGHRKNAMNQILRQLRDRLTQQNIAAHVVGRVKSPYSIYRKMRLKDKTFDEVMDVYGFRIVVESVDACYQTLGVVHNLYKPMSGRFKDFIAIPKSNGYQSLHTLLFGPHGDPLEVQIRTEAMDRLAESGIAAHWVYKSAEGEDKQVHARAREWLLSLLDAQRHAGDSAEFLENVRVELFPDEVYVFTPKGDIKELPRNSTVLDFAYAVHTDVGNHTVAARVDRKLAPLAMPLESGQTVEIVTARSAQPNPRWLDFVSTSKARTGIRHYLKQLQHEDTVQLGHRMLDASLDKLGASLETLDSSELDRFLEEGHYPRLEELLADIALGKRLPGIVARQLIGHEPADSEEGLGATASRDQLNITGAEGKALHYGNCCHPIPGDAIMGHLSAGKGIVVHRLICSNVKEFRKSPQQWVDVSWDPQVSGEFRVVLRLEIGNQPGVLAAVATAIARSDSNIEHVEYRERDGSTATLLFTVTVTDRRHLAAVIRRLRREEQVLQVRRE